MSSNTRSNKKKQRNSPGQGTIKPRTLANGEIVFDAWITVTDPATMEPLKLAKRNAGSTRGEAQAWIAKQVADSAAGVKAVRTRGLTVRGCWEAFKRTTHLKESTVLECERSIHSLTRDMWTLPIHDVTPMRFDALIKTLRFKGIPTTRLVKLVEAWVHVFDGAIISQAAKVNVARESSWRLKLVNDMRNEKAARDVEFRQLGLVKVISAEQYHALLATERRVTIRNIFQLIGETGLRRGEALALEWKDIDLANLSIWIRRGIADIGGKLVHLPTPKGGRARQIYIDEQTAELLHRQRKLVNEWREAWGDRWEDHDLVFPLMDIRSTNKNPPGHWMMPANLSIAYHRRATKLGFDSTKLHGLRYRWATRAFDAGVQPRDIQEHMGHRDLDLTMFTYVETTEERRREAVRIAGQAIRGELQVAVRDKAQLLMPLGDDDD